MTCFSVEVDRALRQAPVSLCLWVLTVRKQRPCLGFGLQDICLACASALCYELASLLSSAS